jgi:4-hydroxy-tetrahydrodipicolinate synthase
LLDAAQKPCVLYDVPSRTGINLSYDALEALKNHKNIWAMKEASGDVKRFCKYATIAPNLKMYSGEDDMLPELVECGAIGLISVISNIWPNQVKQYVEESVAKTLPSNIYEIWKGATLACFEVANPIPTKVWLAHEGVIKTDILRAPLIAKELGNIDNLRKINDLINNYYTI